MKDEIEWQLLSVEYRCKDREIIQESRELFLERIWYSNWCTSFHFYLTN